MDQNVINSVMSHANKGRKILLGHNHIGRVKIKVKYGPLGLITTRYATDHDTYNEIKRRLRLSSILN